MLSYGDTDFLDTRNWKDFWNVIRLNSIYMYIFVNSGKPLVIIPSIQPLHKTDNEKKTSIDSLSISYGP